MPSFDCTTFQPEMTIYKQCCTCCKPPCPPPCPPPPCGPVECDCAAQVRNIITQLLARLPASTEVTFYSSTSTAYTASTPHIAITGANNEMLVLRSNTDQFIAAIPICEIQQISVLTSALAGITLTYYAPPACPPFSCYAKCEADLRAFLGTLGTTAVNVQTSNFVVNQGTIQQIQYGLITQIEGTTTNFISTCHISAIYIPT